MPEGIEQLTVVVPLQAFEASHVLPPLSDMRTVPVPPQRSLKVTNPLEVPTTELSEEEARSFAAWISKFNE